MFCRDCLLQTAGVLKEGATFADLRADPSAVNDTERVAAATTAAAAAAAHVAAAAAAEAAAEAERSAAGGSLIYLSPLN